MKCKKIQGNIFHHIFLHFGGGYAAMIYDEVLAPVYSTKTDIYRRRLCVAALSSSEKGKKASRMEDKRPALQTRVEGVEVC